MATVTIDTSDFVEAQNGANSLKFTDERQQANFELGVSMAIHSWQALDIAVANQWGGAQSQEKRDWISAIVVELFNDKLVDIELIEETILNAMADEFDVHVEDDSSLPIADKVLKCYRQCEAQDYTQVREAFAAWEQKQTERQNRQVVVQEDPENPDSEDDEDDDEDEEDNHRHEHVPQLTEDVEMEDAEPQGPVIDDDGFELVQKKGRRRH